MTVRESIWISQPDLVAINAGMRGTACEALGLEVTEVGADYLIGTMPADARTFQPMGLVHGGANVVLAETLGSIGANLTLDHSKQYAVGLEVNANHLRGVRAGKVTGRAQVLHRGRTTQVWEIKLTDDAGKLTCVSRLTMAVVGIE